MGPPHLRREALEFLKTENEALNNRNSELQDRNKELKEEVERLHNVSKGTLSSAEAPKPLMMDISATRAEEPESTGYDSSTSRADLQPSGNLGRFDTVVKILVELNGRLEKHEKELVPTRAALRELTKDLEVRVLQISDQLEDLRSDCEENHQAVRSIAVSVAADSSGYLEIPASDGDSKILNAVGKLGERVVSNHGNLYEYDADNEQEHMAISIAHIEVKERHRDMILLAESRDQLQFFYEKLNANICDDDQVRRAGPFEVLRPICGVY
jgi:cell division septum initiation protein DivIVA